MTRPALPLALIVLLAAVLLGPPSASAHDRTVTYTVESRGGVTSDVGHFTAVAAATLSDQRGWSLRGGQRFTQVGSGGSFRLVLATPAAVEAASPGCSASWSCRVGELVLINEERWNRGTRSWTGSLAEYRHYVINHEVGHWLGLGHSPCPAPGAPAPVMLQQSISLEGCRASTWPTAAERTRVAQRFRIDSFFRDRGPQLAPGQQLEAGDRLTSPSGSYRAVMQADGNLVVHRGARVVWHAGTHGHPGTHLLMQPDGNLVLYAPGSRPLWHTGTHGQRGSRVVMQDDGNLVVYTPSNRPLWHIGADR